MWKQTPKPRRPPVYNTSWYDRLDLWSFGRSQTHEAYEVNKGLRTVYTFELPSGHLYALCADTLSQWGL